VGQRRECEDSSVGESESTAVRGFEARSLSAEPDTTEMRRFRRRLERTTGIPAARTYRRLIADTVWRSVIAAGFLVPVIVVLSSAISGTFPEMRAAIALPAITAALSGFAIWFVLRPLKRRWRDARPWRRWFRLSGFAHDNGLFYRPELEGVPAGLMFQQGKHGRIVDVLTTPGAAFTIGTFRFVADDARSLDRDPAYSFLRIQLPRPVPHLVLVSRARRGLRGYSSVGLSFAESQRVRLEGDFDRYFAVYAPDGYGADARYVLTPDFMARLADHASQFDLEFVDDTLYVYSATPWDVENPATWVWAQWFAETVGAPALKRTARFSDDRSAAPGVTVAPGGQRLKVAVPLVAGLITVAWVGYQVLRLILSAIQ
jgi:hypothetical protein